VEVHRCPVREESRAIYPPRPETTCGVTEAARQRRSVPRAPKPRTLPSRGMERRVGAGIPPASSIGVRSEPWRAGRTPRRLFHASSNVLRSRSGAATPPRHRYPPRRPDAVPHLDGEDASVRRIRSSGRARTDHRSPLNRRSVPAAEAVPSERRGPAVRPGVSHLGSSASRGRPRACLQPAVCHLDTHSASVLVSRTVRDFRVAARVAVRPVVADGPGESSAPDCT
jgi:hypothetical protein